MADISKAVRDFIGKFTVLKGAARELWLVFALKFLIIAAYAVTNTTLVLWLSSDFGFSDEKALGLIAVWSGIMTVAIVLVGSLTDALGLRRTFFLGVWICIAARAVMVFANLKGLALLGGLVPLAIGEALSAPVSVAAIRRYSNTKQRSISFSVFYVMMNVGFVFAGFIFDFVRQHLGEHGHLVLFGFGISTYRTLFLVSLLIEIMLLPILWFLRDGVEATDTGLKIVPQEAGHRVGNVWDSMYSIARDSLRETVRLFSELLRQTDSTGSCCFWCSSPS